MTDLLFFKRDADEAQYKYEQAIENFIKSGEADKIILEKFKSNQGLTLILCCAARRSNLKCICYEGQNNDELYIDNDDLLKILPEKYCRWISTLVREDIDQNGICNAFWARLELMDKLIEIPITRENTVFEDDYGYGIDLIIECQDYILDRFLVVLEDNTCDIIESVFNIYDKNNMLDDENFFYEHISNILGIDDIEEFDFEACSSEEKSKIIDKYIEYQSI